VTVYSGSDATAGSPGRTKLEGSTVEYTEKGDLASDHLPVVAEFVLR
jgi:hypothetical protein